MGQFNMTINSSDKKFFKWLHSNAEQSVNTHNIDISNIRENMKRLEQFVDSPAEIEFQDINLHSTKNHTIRLRYYHVSNVVKPLIIFFPGNGFIYDLFEANHSVISKIAKMSECHAVMVDYRLAPEYPYPAALEDAMEAVHYIFNNITLFNADINKIILAGYSSGANLAAVITNKVRNNRHTPIFHQFLISGAYDYTNSSHIYDEYVIQDELLSPTEAQFSFDSYCQESQRKESTCSPFWETNLEGLPPTTIMVSEYDGGRNQSEAYAKKLIEAGNDITKIVLPGQTHGTILYRKALSDGKDPACVAADEIHKVVKS